MTDGTEAGTQLLSDLNPGALRSAPLVYKVAGNRLFFIAILPDDRHYTVRTQLWISDGTAAGTRLIFQEPGKSYGYAIDNLTPLGNKLLFTAPNGVDADGFSNDIELFSIALD